MRAPLNLSLCIVVFSIIVFAIISCAQRPFVPVNVGREYGNPTTPWVVSHLPERNKWALARTKPHSIFQQILCFSYPCRKMIGRRKTLQAISMKDFRKRLEKNAKKGYYDHLKKAEPSVEKTPPTVIPKERKDSITVAQAKPLPAKESSVLKADSLITFNEFLFETNSFKLKKEHFSELDQLSQYLVAHPKLKVVVTGHTDNTGNERHNVSLSSRRAEVVAEYLVTKGAIDEQVSFEGFGSSKPIASNDTPEGRSKNRRVEILIKKD